MTEFSLPHKSPHAPSDAHLRGVLFRLSDVEWRQVMGSIPGAFDFMTQVPPNIKRHEPSSAKMWVTRAKPGVLVDWVAMCAAAIGNLARHENPALAQVQSEEGVSLELAHGYLRLVTQLWGCGPAKVMLLGQECIDGVESPVARGEQELLVAIDSWAAETVSLPTREDSGSVVEEVEFSAVLDEASSEPSSTEVEENTSVEDEPRLESVHEACLAAAQSIAGSVENGDKAPAADLQELAAWNEGLDREAEQLSIELGREVLPNLRAISSAAAEIEQALQEREEKTRARNRLAEVEDNIASIEPMLARDLGLGRSGVEDALSALLEERRALRATLGMVDSIPLEGECSDSQPPPSNQEPNARSVRGQQNEGGADLAAEPAPAPEPSVVPMVNSDSHGPSRDSAHAEDRGSDDHVETPDQHPGVDLTTPVQAHSTAGPVRRPKNSSPEAAPVVQSAQTRDDVAVEVDREGLAVYRQLADLVQGGRIAAAYWLSSLAFSESDSLTETLRYAAAAFASGPRGIPPADVTVYAASGLDPQRLIEEPAAATVAIAATARTALNAGYVGNEALLTELTDCAGLPPEWRDLLRKVAVACRSGFRQERFDGLAGVDQSNLATQLQTLQSTLSTKRLNYEAATALLHHMMKPRGDLGAPLKAALNLVSGSGSDDDRARIENFLDVTKSAAEADRFIHSADEQRRRVRFAIEGRAMRSLRTQVLAVRALLDQVMSETATAGVHSDDRRISEVTQADVISWFEAAPELRQIGGEGGVTAVGVAALECLRASVMKQQKASGAERTVEELLRREALLVPGLARDEQGDPVASPCSITLTEAVEALTKPKNDEILLHEYVTKGDLDSAREIAQRLGSEEAQLAVAKADMEWHEAFPARFARVESRLNHAVGSISPFVEADLTSRMQTLQELQSHRRGRYDLDMNALAQVEAELAAAVDSAREELREHLATINGDEPDKQHVEELLESGEFPAARELMALLEAGERLPQAVSQVSEELQDITDLLETYQGSGTLDHLFELIGSPSHDDPRVKPGVRGWKTLTKSNALGNVRVATDSVRAVLRLLGLDVVPSAPVEDVTPRDKARSGFRTYRVTATPNDGSIVPELGSLAHKTYRITVVNTVRADPTLLLAAINDQAGQVATILLYTVLIDAPTRRNLAALIRGSKANALVVDNAVLALMAARYSGSFRSMQRMTLPYAAYTFYTPGMAGEIPDEVFVGRRQELQAIAGTAGGMFVYGGRQLGKSALLRRTQREFSKNDGHVAIYIDLKAEGIGESHEPEKLWPVLGDLLRKQGVLTHAVKNAETVLTRTREWLDEDGQRRVLILLDEADRFLDAEAVEKIVGGRLATFPNIVRLKSLMQSTQRRFKVVFAGLHMVQRFQAIENSPLAHGGQDILVGPLDAAAARELVQEPLRSMGYEFADPDQLWRLLAQTNYVASLVQVAALALVEYLHVNKKLEAGQPPVMITGEDVDAVITNSAVRQEIVSKFRLTLHLDPRYKVIALVMAWLAGSAAFTQHTVAEVREHCRFWWPAGFESLTSREFERYISEMEGLGVLVKQGARVALRSANIVRMLGERDQIEQEIQDAESLELPYDYHPSYTRRLLRANGKGEVVRSPLTDQDLSDLVPRESRSRLRLVVGARATVVERVPEAIKDAVSLYDKDIVLLAPGEVETFVSRNRPQGSAPFPILVVSEHKADDLEGSVRLLEAYCKRRRTAGAVVLDGAVRAAFPVLVPRLGPDVITCDRWSAIGLRAFDHPFAERSQRAELIRATSGWPVLVERALAFEKEGRSVPDVLEEVARYPATKEERAAFLEQAGLDEWDVQALAPWRELTAEGEWLDEADLTAFDLSAADTERFILLNVIERNGQSYALDPVVFRCLAD